MNRISHEADLWHGKPYYSLDAYFKNTFGEKCYKIALNAGLSCPNRDGTLGTGGCIFCSEGGSGDFAAKTDAASIETQLAAGRALFHHKKIGNRMVAYFQAYTNTYGPVSYLHKIYKTALDLPDIVGISIATRPDCLGEEVLLLLARLKEEYPAKFIWIELGLQTVREETARFIRRGYTLDVFETAMANLSRLQIPVIVHVILGLPGETPEDMYATCMYLNRFKPFGIKLQLLHILKNTPLEDAYRKNLLPDFKPLTMDAYLSILIHCLALLNPEITIHRVTGDGPKELLSAPLWSLDKRGVLNTLHKTMKQTNSFQGKLFPDGGCHDAGPFNSV